MFSIRLRYASVGASAAHKALRRTHGRCRQTTPGNANHSPLVRERRERNRTMESLDGYHHGQHGLNRYGSLRRISPVFANHLALRHRSVGQTMPNHLGWQPRATNCRHEKRPRLPIAPQVPQAPGAGDRPDSTQPHRANASNASISRWRPRWSANASSVASTVAS